MCRTLIDNHIFRISCMHIAAKQIINHGIDRSTMIPTLEIRLERDQLEERMYMRVLYVDDQATYISQSIIWRWRWWWPSSCANCVCSLKPAIDEGTTSQQHNTHRLALVELSWCVCVCVFVRLFPPEQPSSAPAAA